MLNPPWVIYNSQEVGLPCLRAANAALNEDCKGLISQEPMIVKRRLTQLFLRQKPEIFIHEGLHGLGNIVREKINQQPLRFS